MGGVASYLTPSVRVLCSLLVPFLRCVQLPMLSILQREQERDAGYQCPAPSTNTDVYLCL